MLYLINLLIALNVTQFRMAPVSHIQISHSHERKHDVQTYVSKETSKSMTETLSFLSAQPKYPLVKQTLGGGGRSRATEGKELFE